MSEQEPTPTQNLTPIPVHKYILSALPALGATIVVIIHLRAPIVSPHYQSILMNAWLGVLCATLAYWLYVALCHVADRICEQFDARHNELASMIEEHSRASARDFRTAMAKLSKACKRLEAVERQNKEMAEELAHLRQLIIGTDPDPLTGPTPFS